MSAYLGHKPVFRTPTVDPLSVPDLTAGPTTTDKPDPFRVIAEQQRMRETSAPKIDVPPAVAAVYEMRRMGA